MPRSGCIIPILSRVIVKPEVCGEGRRSQIKQQVRLLRTLCLQAQNFIKVTSSARIRLAEMRGKVGVRAELFGCDDITLSSVKTIVFRSKRSGAVGSKQHTPEYSVSLCITGTRSSYWLVRRISVNLCRFPEHERSAKAIATWNSRTLYPSSQSRPHCLTPPTHSTPLG